MTKKFIGYKEKQIWSNNLHRISRRNKKYESNDITYATERNWSSTGMRSGQRDKILNLALYNNWASDLLATGNKSNRNAVWFIFIYLIFFCDFFQMGMKNLYEEQPEEFLQAVHRHRIPQHLGLSNFPVQQNNSKSDWEFMCRKSIEKFRTSTKSYQELLGISNIGSWFARNTNSENHNWPGRDQLYCNRCSVLSFP